MSIFSRLGNEISYGVIFESGLYEIYIRFIFLSASMLVGEY